MRFLGWSNFIFFPPHYGQIWLFVPFHILLLANTRIKEPRTLSDFAFQSPEDFYIDSRVIHTSRRRDHLRHWSFDLTYILSNKREGKSLIQLKKQLFIPDCPPTKGGHLICQVGGRLCSGGKLFCGGGLIELLLNYVLFPLIDWTIERCNRLKALFWLIFKECWSMPPSRRSQQLQSIITLKVRPAPREIAEQIFFFQQIIWFLSCSIFVGISSKICFLLVHTYHAGL